MADQYARSFDSVLKNLDQALIRLSRSNTESLLASATTATEVRRAEAATILRRLGQLNPEIANLFQPKAAVVSDLRMRMIVSRQSAPQNVSSYLIVSYCWHYPEWPLAPAAKPIAPGWEISQPMVDAVMALRKTPNEGVWLDKLCIDQGDMSEKQAKIGAMDIIYRSARHVVILLEDVQLTEDEGKAGLAYAGFYAEMCRIVREGNIQGEELMKLSEMFFTDKEEASTDKEKLQQNIRGFLVKLLGARWFTRAWCNHESRVVSHGKTDPHIFLCYGYEGNVLSFEFRYVHYVASHIEQQFEVDLSPDHSRTSDMQRSCWMIQRLLPRTTDDTSAMHHMSSIVRSGCYMKCDLISIALNTSDIPLAFTGRGSIAMVEDALWIFAAVVLARNDVAPLAMLGSPIHTLNEVSGGQTLSWMMFPTRDPVHKKYLTAQASSISGVTREYIELDLYLFLSLPQMASSRSMNTARQFIQEHRLHDFSPSVQSQAEKGLGLLRAETIRIGAQHDPHKDMLVTWLAHAIDHGLDWTSRFPDMVAEEVDHGSWVNGNPGYSIDLRLTKTAKSLYTLSNQHETELHDEDVVERYIKKLTRFLTCILDPRFALLASRRPRRLVCGPGRSMYLSSTSNRSWTAIPLALANLPHWEDRAWIIEPFDPENDPAEDTDSHVMPYISTEREGTDDHSQKRLVFPILTSDSEDQRKPRNEKGTWKLRRKETLLGPRPLLLEEDLRNGGAGVTLLRRQRIYGGKDYDWTAMSRRGQDLRAQHGLA